MSKTGYINWRGKKVLVDILDATLEVRVMYGHLDDSECAQFFSDIRPWNKTGYAGMDLQEFIDNLGLRDKW